MFYCYLVCSLWGQWVGWMEHKLEATLTKSVLSLQSCCVNTVDDHMPVPPTRSRACRTGGSCGSWRRSRWSRASWRERAHGGEEGRPRHRNCESKEKSFYKLIHQVKEEHSMRNFDILWGSRGWDQTCDLYEMSKTRTRAFFWADGQFASNKEVLITVRIG